MIQHRRSATVQAAAVRSTAGAGAPSKTAVAARAQ
jgi:hypothetical protein